MATKTLFGGSRGLLARAVLASVGGLTLAGCCNTCSPCQPVYKRPCCAQQPCGPCGGGQSCGGKPAAPPAAPTGGQMSCGAGKCG